MKIKTTEHNFIDSYRNRVDKAEEEQQKNQASTTKLGAGNKQDRISVSSEAKVLTTALSTAMQTQDVRQQKVDEIKARIDAGEYSIDAKDIAQKLLQNEADLISTIER